MLIDCKNNIVGLVGLLLGFALILLHHGSEAVALITGSFALHASTSAKNEQEPDDPHRRAHLHRRLPNEVILSAARAAPKTAHRLTRRQMPSVQCTVVPFDTRG
jgi:hypothetical protein